MKAELMDRMTGEQMQRAHAAYTTLACLYEDLCDGPMKARQYKEYFAIMDNREALRRRFNQIVLENDGKQ